MGVKRFHVEHSQSVRVQHPLGGEERKVRKVLVIDRVELALLDELHQMRKLQGDHAVRRQQLFQTRHEVVEVGHVGQDVVADEKICAPILVENICGSVTSEVPHFDGYAPRLGDLRDVGRRLDAEHVEATRGKMLQEIAVIACDLDNAAVGAKAEPPDDLVAVRPRVRDPTVRVRREVRVVVEELFGRHDRLELHEQALPADPHVQRIELLRLVQPIRRHILLAERRQAQIDKRVLETSSAEAAATHRAILSRGALARPGGQVVDNPVLAVHERLIAAGALVVKRGIVGSKPVNVVG